MAENIASVIIAVLLALFLYFVTWQEKQDRKHEKEVFGRYRRAEQTE